MLLGRKKNARNEDNNAEEVRAFVEINRIGRGKRRVKAYLVNTDNAKTVYKSQFATKASTDLYAYNIACDDLMRTISREDYVLFGEIGTNGKLPVIETSNKRTR